MTRTPADVLREAQTHFTLMTRHARGDLADQLVIDAICMRLSAGVEALARLDTATRDRLFGDAWPLMWGDAQPHRTRLPARRHRHRAPDPGARHPPRS